MEFCLDAVQPLTQDGRLPYVLILRGSLSKKKTFFTNVLINYSRTICD